MTQPAQSASNTDRLYFRQLLAGKDFAKDDPFAQQMANYLYIVGDRESGEAIAIDPTYAIDDLFEVLATDEMRLTGVLATHYHPDHVGGDLMGHHVQGIQEILAKTDVPIHIQQDEAPWVEFVTGTKAGKELVLHTSGDTVSVGGIDISLIHTPGHTPGSQCFLVEGKLLSGDTLFLEGCGRTDLPGGNPEELYESLIQRLAKIPDDTVLYPGHNYSAEASATMGHTRGDNSVFKPKSASEWVATFAS